MPRLPHEKYAKLAAKYNSLLYKLNRLDSEIMQLLLEVRPSGVSEKEWLCAIEELNETDPVVLTDFSASLKDQIRSIEVTLEGDET